MSKETVLQAKDLIVGKALPYSVYGSDNMLLLAKGQIVSERVRDALLRSGARAVLDRDPEAEFDKNRVDVPETCPLQAFRNAYSKNLGGNRIGFRMSRDDRSETFTAWVIGAHEQRGLILSAPLSRENSLVALAEGQTWVFRAFHGTAAFRFAGVVRKVVFEPVAYFHLQLPQAIEMRRVRQRPRAQVCLPAALETGGNEATGVIVDLSAIGLRLAMKQGDELQKNQILGVRFSVPLLDKTHDIQATAKVVAIYGAADQRHPNVNLYGLCFTSGSELERMILHAYVQERLVDELDSIWRVLAGSGGLSMVQEGTAAA